MKQFNSILLLSLVWLLWSCSGKTDEPGGPVPPEPAGLPIHISTGLAPQSRAGDPLENTHTTFAVIARKTMPDGTSQTVMAHDAAGTIPYRVDYDSATPCWYYAGITYDSNEQHLKYWDLAASSYTFTGYAPYAYDPSKGSVSVNAADGSIAFHGISTEEGAIDWLECDYMRTSEPKDYDRLAAGYDPASSDNEPYDLPTAMYSDVPLVFHHVLSAIVFKIYNTEGQEIKVNSFKAVCDHPLYTYADYDKGFTYDTDKYITGICDIASYDPEVKTGKTANTASELFQMPVVPQQLIDYGADIILDLGPEHTIIETKMPLGTSTNGYQWLRGRVYTYILALTLGNDIILVDVEVSPWIAGDTIDVTQTNW